LKLEENYGQEEIVLEQSREWVEPGVCWVSCGFHEGQAMRTGVDLIPTVRTENVVLACHQPCAQGGGYIQNVLKSLLPFSLNGTAFHFKMII
jgi:hypothetical protein